MDSEQLEELIKSIDRVFAGSPDFFYVYDHDSVCLYANESGAKTYRLSKSTIIGKKWGELNLSPEAAAAFEARLKAVFSTGEPATVEVYTETVSGSYDFEYVLTPIIEKGAVVAAVGVARDTTEQKETERLLRESQRRFQDLFEKSELVAVIVDNQGKTIFVNDYTLSLLGRSREGVLGKEFINYVTPVQREQVRNAFMQAIMTGEILSHYTSDITTAQGQRRTISFTNVILRNAEGNVIGTANLGQDITDEHRAAIEISESRAQVLDILESITDGFFALDNLWRFTYVNQRAAELVGKRKEELLFKDMWRILPELVGTRFDIEYHRAKDEMVPISFEEYYPPQNKWFDVHAYPYENGLSVYFTDVTKRKQLEEERERLLALIKELAKKV